LPRREPALAEFAADMREVADALRLARFSVVGISGGGPFAAAVAAELPERVERLALIAPVGPIAPAADCHRPFDRFHRFTFTALPRIPGGVRLTFSAFRVLLALDPGLAVTAVAARAHKSDRQVVRDRAHARALGETMRAGLAAGAAGPVIDMTLFSKPWNVDLNAITATTRLWLGLDDRNVPLGPARHLAAAIPGATLREIPRAGHFWIMQNFDQVFAWLTGRRA
jgi:pimeloyl-ACP methyl ester carboxylesterase